MTFYIGFYNVWFFSSPVIILSNKFLNAVTENLEKIINDSMI